MRASKENLSIFDMLLGVVGFDNDEGNKDDESETDEESEENEEENEESDEEESKDDDKDKEANNLREALRKERKERRKFEREATRLKKDSDRAKDKDTSDADKARKDAEEAQGKTQRLAVKLRNTATDNVITKLATKMKFRDLDDALKLIDRSKIEVDQDDEEPEEIEIDETSVNDALKTLAKSKPHLLIAAGDGDPSGGNLGSKTNEKDKLDDTKLKDLYPALRR